MIGVVVRIVVGLLGAVVALSALGLLIGGDLVAAAGISALAVAMLWYAVAPRRKKRVLRRGEPVFGNSFDFLSTADRHDRKAAAPLIGNAWPAKGEFACDVVGESRYQDALIAAVGAQPTAWHEVMVTAHLVCERDNPHDPKAVAVYVDGKRVGYLPRDHARTFHKRLARRGIAGHTTSCGAMIRGGGTADDGQPRMFGIWLDIAPFW